MYVYLFNYLILTFIKGIVLDKKTDSFFIIVSSFNETSIALIHIGSDYFP